MGIIYCAKNTTNGKMYIGQTKHDLSKRQRQHQAEAERLNSHQRNYCRAITHALHKYGANAFEWSILYDHVQNEDLNTAEIEAIAKFETLSPNGYNLTKGGVTGLPSDETRQNMRNSRLGKPLSEETKKKLSEALKGRPKSEETKQRMRMARKKIVTSEATREKIGKAHRGKSLSAEHKKKLYDAHFGKKHTAESIKKMSDAKKGKVRSASHCLNISRANKGKTIPPETRQRMSESQRKRWVTRRALLADIKMQIVQNTNCH